MPPLSDRLITPKLDTWGSKHNGENTHKDIIVTGPAAENDKLDNNVNQVVNPEQTTLYEPHHEKNAFCIIMRKKTQISCAVNQPFCFCCTDSTIPLLLNPNFKLLFIFCDCTYSPVCVEAGLKTQKRFFSRCSSCGGASVQNSQCAQSKHLDSFFLQTVLAEVEDKIL